MTLKETILPLADGYAIEKWADAMHERQIKGDTNKARAALVAALDAADAEIEARDAHDDVFVARINELLAENAALRLDAERMDYMQNHLLRKATMRFDMEFKEVNAWTIASANTNLREALDAARAALGQGHD